MAIPTPWREAQSRPRAVARRVTSTIDDVDRAIEQARGIQSLSPARRIVLDDLTAYRRHLLSLSDPLSRNEG